MKRPSRATSAIPTGARSNTERKRSTASARASSARRTSVRSWQIPCRCSPALPGVVTIAPRKCTSRSSPVGLPDAGERVEVAAVARARASTCSRIALAVLRRRSAREHRARRDEGLRVLAEDPVHLARPRDLVAGDVPVEGADLREPLRLGQPLLGAAAVRDVDAGAVDPAHRAVRARCATPPRQCSTRISPSPRTIRTSSSSGAPPASAARPASQTRSRSSSWTSSSASSPVGASSGAEAEQAAELGRPRQLAGLGLPVPAADAGDLLRLGQLPLAAAQLVLGALAVGDVGRDADHRRPALPSASNTGVLWVRCVRPPQPSSTSIGRPVAQDLARSARPSARPWRGRRAPPAACRRPPRAACRPARRPRGWRARSGRPGPARTSAPRRRRGRRAAGRRPVCRVLAHLTVGRRYRNPC